MIARLLGDQRLNLTLKYGVNALLVLSLAGLYAPSTREGAKSLGLVFSSQGERAELSQNA